MKNTTKDFKIVTIQNRKAITTSLLVAYVFNKEHKSVLRAMDNLMLDCDESFTRHNFALSDYQDSTGRTLPMITMTRAGFTLLAMGFTGKPATAWKIKYINAFDKMEAALNQKHNLEWQQSRTANKTVRQSETATIQAFIHYAMKQGSSNAQRYYILFSKLAYLAIGVSHARDILDSIQLSFLTTAEHMIQQILNDGMAAGLPYKEIYRNVKDKLNTLTKSLTIHQPKSD